jgi:hypothetical protein
MINSNLVGGWPTPLKNMSSSVGILIPNIREKKMFQTTNQGWYPHKSMILNDSLYLDGSSMENSVYLDHQFQKIVHNEYK